MMSFLSTRHCCLFDFPALHIITLQINLFRQDLQDDQDIFCFSSLRYGGLNGKKSNSPPGRFEFLGILQAKVD